jgi:hypothetical protein
MKILNGIRLVCCSYGPTLAVGMEGDQELAKRWADGMFNWKAMSGEFIEMSDAFGYVLLPNIGMLREYLMGVVSRRLQRAGVGQYSKGRKGGFRHARGVVDRAMQEIKWENFLGRCAE